MTNEDIIAALKRYDKHLWGIDASYKDAAKIIGCKPNRIKTVLWSISKCISTENGKVLKTISEWNGYLQWFKCPDADGGPRSPTKDKSISRKSWDRLRQLFSEKRGLIESDGATMEFVIRLCRKNRLPANEHIVNEMLCLKKMSLKGVV